MISGWLVKVLSALSSTVTVIRGIAELKGKWRRQLHWLMRRRRRIALTGFIGHLVNDPLDDMEPRRWRECPNLLKDLFGSARL
jgi:hypothetical protein